MKKNILNIFKANIGSYAKNTIKTSCLVFSLMLANQSNAQETTITVFDDVIFYGGYTATLSEEALYEPMPAEVLRHSNSRYARKLTDTELDAMGNTLDIDLQIGAACDNYDRLCHVFLAFTPKEATTYVSEEVPRVEIARLVTPFMNKNYSPTTLSYEYTANNVSEIVTNTSIRNTYDIWVELQLFGTTGAGQEQVAGCSGHLDTFRATLNFTSDTDDQITYTDDLVFMPLVANSRLNNYNATDVTGKTTKIIDFTLTEDTDNLKLILITSNHGANSGGEEYVRRRHYVYLDETLIYEYIPGGKSCEPYRQYNTQGNGIYGASQLPLRGWIYWNNWCPGDRIPTYEIDLGTLPAGEHSVTIDVPEAEFVDSQGYIPVSAYLINRESGATPICTQPTNVTAEAISDHEIFVNWDEIGNADEWEVLYGKIYNSAGQVTYTVLAEEDYLQVTDGESEGTATENVVPSTVYQVFVRSKCDNEENSRWSQALYVQTQELSVEENILDTFKYYPNPVSDNLMLQSDNEAIDGIAIYDMQGRQVLQENIGSTQAVVNMVNFPTGIYFLMVNTGGKTQTYKVEKQ